MPKIPPVTGTDVVNLLQDRGWTVTQQTGSHVTMSNGTDTVSVPVHGSKTLPIGILRSAGIAPSSLRR